MNSRVLIFPWVPRLLLAVLLSLGAQLSVQAAEPLPYTVTLLSLPSDVRPGDVHLVNDSGDVVFSGVSEVQQFDGPINVQPSFIRYRDGSVGRLWEGLPNQGNWPEVDVYALNNHGQVLIGTRVDRGRDVIRSIALNDHGKITLFPAPGPPWSDIRQAFLTDAGKIIVNIDYQVDNSDVVVAYSLFWTGKKWEKFPAFPGLPHQWIQAVRPDGTAYGISMGTYDVYDHLKGEPGLQTTAVCQFRPGKTEAISPLRGTVFAINERGDFVICVGQDVIFQPRGKPQVALGKSRGLLFTVGDIGNAILSPQGTLAYAKITSRNGRSDYIVRYPDGAQFTTAGILTRSPEIFYADQYFGFSITDSGVLNIPSTVRTRAFQPFFQGEFHSILEAAPFDAEWIRLVNGMAAIYSSGGGDAANLYWRLSRTGVGAAALYERITDDFQIINPRLALFRPGRAEVRALEVTQVVQDWSNSIPLIAGKQTMVRGHIEATQKDAINKPARGTLRGFHDGLELPGSPLAPLNKKGAGVITKNAATVRDKIGNALDFLLPPQWPTNTLELRLDSSDGGFLGRTETVTFTNVPPMLAKLFPLTVQFLGSDVPTPDADAILFREKALGLLPVPAIETGAFRHDIVVDSEKITKEDDLDNVNAMLRLALLRDADAQGLTVANATEAAKKLGYYIGVTDTIDFGAIADDVPGVAATITGLASIPNRGAHEVAHLLGQPHATLALRPGLAPHLKAGFCDEYANRSAPDFPFFGSVPGEPRQVPLLGPINKTPEEQMFGATMVDGKLQVFSPLRHFELMGYCDKPTRWISGYTYTNCLQAFLNFRAATAPKAPSLFARAVVPRMIVRGQFNFLTGAASLQPSLPLPPGPLPALPASGEFALQFKNAAGDLLSTVLFAIPEPVELESIKSFIFIVAPPADATRLEVVRNAQVLASATASANPPSVRIISPNSGALAGPQVELTWEAADADGDPLRFAVDYSPDGGLSWKTLNPDTAQRRLAVRLSSLEPSQNGHFRVTATDGLNFAIDSSDLPLTIPRQAPIIAALSPSLGTQFEPGETIVFQAAGAEALFETTWRSDRDGLLGAGLKFSRPAESLSPGLHQITVAGRDAAGQTGSNTFPIFVAEFPIPQITGLEADGSSLMLNLQTAPDLEIVVEASSNLVTWFAVTNALALTEQSFFELPLDPGARFFRASSRPIAPSLNADLEDVEGPAGLSAILAVTAAGSSPLSYYWLRNGTPIPGAPNQPSFTFANPGAAQSGTYSVIISNRLGTVTSRTASVIFTNQIPTIDSQPQDQCFRAGFSTEFSVRAAGIPEPTYQWFFNNQPIPNATKSFLAFETPTEANLGEYFVRVTNEAGALDGRVVRLKVCP